VTNYVLKGGNLVLPIECISGRRNFLKGGVAMVVGFSTVSTLRSAAAENAWIIGPQPGFAPEIGTLTSMLAFTRMQVLHNAMCYGEDPNYSVASSVSLFMPDSRCSLGVASLQAHY
jgi:hypothetical protein